MSTQEKLKEFEIKEKARDDAIAEGKVAATAFRVALISAWPTLIDKWRVEILKINADQFNSLDDGAKQELKKRVLALQKNSDETVNRIWGDYLAYFDASTARKEIPQISIAGKHYWHWRDELENLTGDFGLDACVSWDDSKRWSKDDHTPSEQGWPSAMAEAHEHYVQAYRALQEQEKSVILAKTAYDQATAIESWDDA